MGILTGKRKVCDPAMGCDPHHAKGVGFWGGLGAVVALPALAVGGVYAAPALAGAARAGGTAIRKAAPPLGRSIGNIARQGAQDALGSGEQPQYGPWASGFGFGTDAGPASSPGTGSGVAIPLVALAGGAVLLWLLLRR